MRHDLCLCRQQRRVKLGRSEAHAADVRGKALVPGPGRLLEPVQGLLQETYVVRLGSLLEVAVEESIHV